MNPCPLTVWNKYYYYYNLIHMILKYSIYIYLFIYYAYTWITWYKLLIWFKEGWLICSELGKGATSEAGKFLFGADNAWWRCVQYFVNTSCGLMPRDNRCMYMEHVCFYVCCSDCVGACGKVCCVAAVVKDLMQSKWKKIVNWLFLVKTNRKYTI